VWFHQQKWQLKQQEWGLNRPKIGFRGFTQKKTHWRFPFETTPKQGDNPAKVTIQLWKLDLDPQRKWLWRGFGGAMSSFLECRLV